MSENKQNVRNLVQIAAFTALLAIMAQISIPMPAGVPMTMQTLAVPLAGLILGAKRGTLATVLYRLCLVFSASLFSQAFPEALELRSASRAVLSFLFL